MAALEVEEEDQMGTIRIEADRTSELTDVYAWLARHRGRLVQLDNGSNLTLGSPISGARAVIIAAALDNGVGGVLRVLSNPVDPRRVRFVFDIRAKGRRAAADVHEIGEQVIEAITEQVARGPMVARVA